MLDHKISNAAVTNHGISSAGQSQNPSSTPKILNTERSFAERGVTYVDCWLARNGYTGRQWFEKLQAECEQRHQDFLSIQAARKAFGVEAIPYGLTLPADLAARAEEPTHVS